MKLPTKKPDSEVNRKTLKRRNIKREAIQYKGGCCQRCGYDKYEEALDFHHIDPKTKKFGICRMLRKTVSWARIKKEIDKCQLLCCRCHREVHIKLNEQKRKSKKRSLVKRESVKISPRKARSLSRQ